MGKYSTPKMPVMKIAGTGTSTPKNLAAKSPMAMPKLIRTVPASRQNPPNTSSMPGNSGISFSSAAAAKMMFCMYSN